MDSEERKRFSTLEKDVSEIKGQIKELSMRREEIFFLSEKHAMEAQERGEKLDAIHQAIVGNEAMGHVGLVKTIQLQEKRIEVLEEFIDKLKIALAKMGAIGGIVGSAITLFLTWLFKFL